MKQMSNCKYDIIKLSNSCENTAPMVYNDKFTYGNYLENVENVLLVVGCCQL